MNKGATDEQTVKTFSPCVSDLGITQIVYIGDTNWPYRPVRVKCNIDPVTAMVIQEKAADWPGVGIEVVSVREYPTGGLTSEVVGFLGPLPQGQEDYDCYKNANLDQEKDKVGYGGIEAYLQCDKNGDPLLSGINGKRYVEVDVAAPDPGDDRHAHPT